MLQERSLGVFKEWRRIVKWKRIFWKAHLEYRLKRLGDTFCSTHFLYWANFINWMAAMITDCWKPTKGTLDFLIWSHSAPITASKRLVHTIWVAFNTFNQYVTTTSTRTVIWWRRWASERAVIVGALIIIVVLVTVVVIFVLVAIIDGIIVCRSTWKQGNDEIIVST